MHISDDFGAGSLGTQQEGECRGRVLFADDDRSVLLPTARALRAEGFVVTTVESGAAARAELERSGFSVLLTDIDMPGNQDLELLNFVVDHLPNTPVVVLTGHPTVATAVSSVRLGVVDYLTKPGTVASLVERLDAAVHGGRVLRSVEAACAQAKEVAARLDGLAEVIRNGPGGLLRRPSGDPLENLDPEALERLSQRERQVLVELAKGQATQKVARVLGLSPHTVRNHLKSIFVKLGVNSQVALLGKLASRRSIVPNVAPRLPTVGKTPSR